MNRNIFRNMERMNKLTRNVRRQLMYGDIIQFVQNLNDQECLSLAAYFYNICYDIDNVNNYYDGVQLIKAFITRFKKEESVENAVRAFIDFHIEKKNLHLIEIDDDKSAFDCDQPLGRHFLEDFRIEKDLSDFITDTAFDVDVCRCIFLDKNFFTKLIAYVCFCDTEKTDVKFEEQNDIIDFDFLDKILEDVSPIDFIIKQLHLSQEEAQLLLLIYRTNVIPEFSKFFESLIENDYTQVVIYAKALRVPPQKIKNLLRRDKKLVTYGFIQTDCSITHDIIDCISSGSLDPFFCNILKEEKLGTVFSADSFSIKQEFFELALQFLQGSGPVNILYIRKFGCR